MADIPNKNLMFIQFFFKINMSARPCLHQADVVVTHRHYVVDHTVAQHEESLHGSEYNASLPDTRREGRGD
jgi:hypothetical protein